MPTSYDCQLSKYVADQDVIQKHAGTESERRKALRKLLDNDWASREIGLLRRIENSQRWGWEMCPYQPAEKGPPKPKQG